MELYKVIIAAVIVSGVFCLLAWWLLNTALQSVEG